MVVLRLMITVTVFGNRNHKPEETTKLPTLVEKVSGKSVVAIVLSSLFVGLSIIWIG
jgi:hypothetical protein